jgi:hypothetical protein
MPTQDSTRPSSSESSPSLFNLYSDKLSTFLLAILLAYAGFTSICRAAARPFWYDEICTFIMLRQQRISYLWRALKQGADVHPPGFYIAERFAIAFAANENIAFRLLSILSFLCTVLCLFILVRKRRGGMISLLCAGISLSTVLYDYFAVESRPYSLVVACIAFALVCYERAPAVRWMVLMGFSLALAQSFHYYAFFSFLPFVVSEAVLFLTRRHLRWPVWLALGCGILPLIAFWPLLWPSRALYGAHFWALPSLRVAQSSYGLYLETLAPTGLYIAAATAFTVLVTLLYRIRQGGREGRASEVSLQEPMIILTFLSLPFIGVATAWVTHGGMTAKYVLSAALGFPLAVSYVFPRFGPKSPVPIAVLALFLLTFTRQEKLFWSSYTGNFSSPAEPVEAFVGTAGHADLPVVISDPQVFMTLSHYASPAWSSRFVSVVDAPEAVAYVGTDSADKELPILAAYFPLHVYDFQAFVAEHPAFLLYSNQGGAGGDWWPRKLMHDGYALRPVALKPKEEFDFLHRVFLVSRVKDAD